MEQYLPGEKVVLSGHTYHLNSPRLNNIELLLLISHLEAVRTNLCELEFSD